MKIFKRGPDNLIFGTVLGIAVGALIATSNIIWIQNIVTAIMNWIPAEWLSWAGSYASIVVFSLIGGIIGYIVDYK